MAKKTAKKKAVKKTLSKAEILKRVEPKIVVQNCKMVGLEFSVEAMDAIRSIAEAIAINARALSDNADALCANAVTLGSLAEMLNSNHVQIENILQFGKGASHIAILGNTVKPV